MVVTTLMIDVAMPDATEIQKMITDPIYWLNNYKVGGSYRYPTQGAPYSPFVIDSPNASYSTQVWLMGDGSNDSYSNMIRSQVRPGDQNYVRMEMISMVSNDIETVNIPGLS